MRRVVISLVGIALLLCAVKRGEAEDLCRVHQNPDRTVRVTCPAETPAWLQGLPYLDVLRSELDALPQAKQHAWRIEHGKVIVDATVPDPPKTKEQLRKEACAKIKADPLAGSALKEFCATY